MPDGSPRRVDAATHAATPSDPVRAGLLISIAVGLVGVTYGVLARSAGLSVLQTCAMSLLVFTGASQFAIVGVVAGGGTVLAGFGAAVMLAARNALYGPVVSRTLPATTPRWKRLLLAQLVIDESTGVAAAQPDEEAAHRGFLATGVGVFVLWNLGSLLGALGGDVIGDPNRFGLDAAFPACSLALLAPHLRARPGRVAALVAVGIALVAVPVVPVGVPILLGAVAIVPAWFVRNPMRDVDPDLPGRQERPA